ncbi:hypothetical protein CHU94_00125 [Rhodoferax sp. TH121]|nr:hypothetical protein CHU94_00125 [Rhodoferax sp. TH121]
MWAVCAVFVLVIAGTFAWKASELVAEAQATAAEMERMQSETDRLRRLSAPKPHPRSASALKAVTLLQFDVNKVFSAMENVDVAGTRLTGVTLDMASGNLAMEYALEQSTQGQAITEALNSGYDARPWYLDRISSSPASAVIAGSVFTTPGGLPKLAHNGLWRVAVSKL